MRGWALVWTNFNFNRQDGWFVYNMVTLTSLAALSGLLYGTAFSDMNTGSAQNIVDNKNEVEIVESYDVWSGNSITMELSTQHSNSSKTKYSAKSSGSYNVSTEGVVPVSAYSSTPDQTDDSPFIMASGKHVYDGAVAANFLPLGTKVRFPDLYGDKIFTVEDRMNKRYHYKMDIWMETRSEALRFGVKNLRYEVVVDSNKTLAAAK